MGSKTVGHFRPTIAPRNQGTLTLVLLEGELSAPLELTLFTV
jgi:hypothetical protein